MVLTLLLPVMIPACPGWHRASKHAHTIVGTCVNKGWIQWAFCELKRVHYSSSNVWEQCLNTQWVRHCSVGDADKCFHRFETCSKDNWKTATQALILSADLLGILHFWVCRAFRKQNVYYRQWCLLGQMCMYGLLFTKCDHVMQHAHRDTHKQHTYTYTETLARRQSQHGLYWSELTCARPGNKHLALWLRQNVTESNTSPN